MDSVPFTNQSGGKKPVLILVALGILISGFYLYQKPTKPADLVEVTLGVETSILPASVWVAENKGYFQDEGLDLTIVPYDSGRLSLLALLEDGDDIDICTVAPTPIMFKSFERHDFTIISTFAYSYEDVKVIARKDHGIEEAADLVGKKIGTPFGTTGQFVLEVFLIYNGLSTSSVEAVDISPQELPGSLDNGLVDAIVIWEPFAYQAKALLGSRGIALPSSEVYKETFNFVVMENFAVENPGALHQFLKAIDTAMTFIELNKGESQQIVADRLDLDVESVVAFWDDFVFELSLSQSLLITLEDEARWALRNDLVDATEAPNYLDFIYEDALKAFKPENVGIIH